MREGKKRRRRSDLIRGADLGAAGQDRVVRTECRALGGAIGLRGTVGGIESVFNLVAEPG